MSRSITLALVLGACASATPAASAATLRPGDFVLGGSYTYGYTPGVIQIDPATLDTTVISSSGLLTGILDIAVGYDGRIFVVDDTHGLLEIDAVTGAQVVLATTATLGARAEGVCVGRDGRLFLSLVGPASGIVRRDLDGTLTPVTSGDLLTAPGGLELGSDGALYVTEQSLPDWGHLGQRGSIVRVDPGSGAQSLVSADTLLNGPVDLATAPDGAIWIVNRGYVAGRSGCLLRIQPWDGYSERIGSTCRSKGVAFSGSTALISDCYTIGPDCYTPFVARYPASAEYFYMGGRIATVPLDAVPTRRASWGSLKIRYR